MRVAVSAKKRSCVKGCAMNIDSIGRLKALITTRLRDFRSRRSSLKPNAPTVLSSSTIPEPSVCDIAIGPERANKGPQAQPRFESAADHPHCCEEPYRGTWLHLLPSLTMSQEDASAREASRYEQKYLVAPKTPGFEVRTESINLLDEDDGKSLAFKPIRQRISLINLAVNWVLRSRITIRVLAVMASLVSFVLITYSVVLFENARKAGNVKDSTGANPQVNVKAAVTFSGIGGASFFLSLLLLFACCGSKKVRC